MLKHTFRNISLLLLTFAISSCVTIPPEMQLVAMDVEMGQMQVQANCTHGNRTGFIKAGARSESVLDTNRISLINWNIYKGQRDNWASDFNKHIQQQDIVVIQEAVLKQELYQALSAQQLHWSLNTAFYYEDAEAGVLTASKVRALRSCGLRAKEPLIRIPKTILISEYRLSNSEHNLLVANIHSINFTLGTGAYMQQIASLANAIRHHEGPVIVAGDFNTWSDSRMGIVNQMAELLSLDAVTYKQHNRLMLFGNPLDHVFYRGLELIKEETLEVTSSDHNPIKVTFRMPSSQLAGTEL
ncbi:MAG: endonuclease/exonuclease/phosphatase family protein [Gammaproteobacteria bacterium]